MVPGQFFFVEGQGGPSPCGSCFSRAGGTERNNLILNYIDFHLPPGMGRHMQLLGQTKGGSANHSVAGRVLYPKEPD